ncbi:uncharacterized protein M421DRAFT_212010 [Didymella exigua CBS 183.55]|uniref:Uncharacterized protein n=1 Tax=Didymella exigua CBS 183.55 TaxID=1150837 RepID=A0A6A5RGL0_9PLEO|nr:uncharacterized protein M421DRAFT_212010 [Didymella exigua CBS 183.55]KAF1926623.1 hypothetical protein M421DRAFT_212010 [Didymella exigua CBS 183.55]
MRHEKILGSIPRMGNVFARSKRWMEPCFHTMMTSISAAITHFFLVFRVSKDQHVLGERYPGARPETIFRYYLLPAVNACRCRVN